jgi:formamidase
MVNGYTAVFDDTRQVGVTVTEKAAEKIARSANQFAALPESSARHSIPKREAPSARSERNIVF